MRQTSYYVAIQVVLRHKLEWLLSATMASIRLEPPSAFDLILETG